MKIRNTYKTASITFVFALLWLLSGLLSENKNQIVSKSTLETISSVTVLKSEAQLHSKKIRVSGFTEAEKLVNVRAEIGGRVISTPFNQGDFVKEGDLICQLYIAGREAYPKIFAPFDGYLERVQVENGDYLNQGGICATLIDPNPMLVVGEISEKEISLVELNAKAKAKLISGKEIQGLITFVGTSADRVARTFRVEMSVENVDRSIRDGISASFIIEGNKIPSHKISPAILMLGNEGQLGVRTVNSRNEVEFNRIEILEDTLDGIWITGLPDSTRIITVGQEYVYLGQTVQVQEIESPEV